MKYVPTFMLKVGSFLFNHRRSHFHRTSSLIWHFSIKVFFTLLFVVERKVWIFIDLVCNFVLTSSCFFRWIQDRNGPLQNQRRLSFFQLQTVRTFHENWKTQFRLFLAPRLLLTPLDIMWTPFILFQWFSFALSLLLSTWTISPCQHRKVFFSTLKKLHTYRLFAEDFLKVWGHISCISCSDPYVLLQTWNMTFLIFYNILNAKWAKKIVFTNGLLS